MTFTIGAASGLRKKLCMLCGARERLIYLQAIAQITARGSAPREGFQMLAKRRRRDFDLMVAYRRHHDRLEPDCLAAYSRHRALGVGYLHSCGKRPIAEYRAQ